MWETIERYFFGVDAKDKTSLISCFSADAEAIYHWGTPEQKTIVGGVSIGEDVYAACSRFTSSTHSTANRTISLFKEAAEANTFAIAHVVHQSSLIIRGLRYQDRLILAPQGWRIVQRKHTPLWQTEAPALPPKLF